MWKLNTKKQSGGHGQYGHVKMRFEPPGSLETPICIREQEVVGGVPSTSAIEKVSRKLY